MNKILITGSNSYIGKKFKEYVEKKSNTSYLVDTISLRTQGWQDNDFSKYSVIIHTVGIAHINEKKVEKKLYYKINSDLAYEVAKKAKDEGVEHFIFISSMSIFGSVNGPINEHTPNNPTSEYGKSKLLAEKKLFALNDSGFKVSIIRPPMVYGDNCKGNYKKLAKLAIRVPLFCSYKNTRSMIFIDNLNLFLFYIMDTSKAGYFHPQNKEYVCTSDMVKHISEANGKRMLLTKFFNPFIRLTLKNSMIDKVFGDLYYEKSFSAENGFDEKMLVGLKESITLSERDYL
ncbi:NAD-dependent epimerase/dehydratase family protein [Rossellomorea sp. H39__3]